MSAAGPERPAATPVPTPAWPLFRAMVGVGAFCGLLIVSVFLVTRPVIQRKQAEALQRALFQVLPDARTSASFRFAADGGFERLPDATAAPGEPVVHAGYDADGRLVGLALEARSMGYQDVIRLLYGYSFVREAIVGIRVLESRETPGLGDRIETDPTFQANFEQLDVAVSADGETLAHPIVAVRHGEKEEAWQVDGITGATISSVAVADALQQSASLWVPRIRRHLDGFEQGVRP